MKILILCAVFIGLAVAQRRDSRCPQNDNSRTQVHLPHPTDCGSFLKCHLGSTYEIRCPLHLHWNVASDSCDSPINARCTIVNQRPQLPPQRPNIPNPRPELEHPDYLNCPIHDTPGRAVYFPYHLNCSQFYQCVTGRAVL